MLHNALIKVLYRVGHWRIEGGGGGRETPPPPSEVGYVVVNLTTCGSRSTRYSKLNYTST